MAEPLHTLKHEHRVIERALRALEGVCIRLDWGQHVPVEVISQLVDFMGEFADRYHHGKEEACLFPLLQRHGIVRGGPLGVIAEEHRIESDLTAQMHRAIEGYRDVDAEARQRFVDAARRYTRHLLSHIDKEESILFRLADEMLDEEDKVSLSKSFNRAETAFHAGGHQKYEHIASELEQTWAL
jgi:hemerythrin-like domain-containing protein